MYRYCGLGYVICTNGSLKLSTLFIPRPVSVILTVLGLELNISNKLLAESIAEHLISYPESNFISVNPDQSVVPPTSLIILPINLVLSSEVLLILDVNGVPKICC